MGEGWWGVDTSGVLIKREGGRQDLRQLGQDRSPTPVMGVHQGSMTHTLTVPPLMTHLMTQTRDKSQRYIHIHVSLYMCVSCSRFLPVLGRWGRANPLHTPQGRPTFDSSLESPSLVCTPPPWTSPFPWVYYPLKHLITLFKSFVTSIFSRYSYRISTPLRLNHRLPSEHHVLG